MRTAWATIVSDGFTAVDDGRKSTRSMSTISYLTRIEFGEGQIVRLPEFLAALGIQRPLIATDKGLVATGLVENVAALLKAPPAIYDGTPANPTEDAVLDAYNVYKQSGCDGIIGLGGGSALDLAKGVRLLTGHEGPLAEFFGAAPDVAISGLNQTIGIPLGLAAMGVTEEMMQHVSPEALKDHCHATNPRIPTATDYLQIMHDAS